jgi:ATP adenylyltransferase
MDKLWAPWRSKYIYLKKSKACIFCKNGKSGGRAGYVIERSAHSFAMLNIYPYNNGHVMAAPYRHVGSLDKLSESEITDLFKLVNNITTRINERLKPHGYNIGLNIGRVGGAGFAGHVHVHIVPRWAGDTNFMPVTAGTKIISESLDAVYKLLKK